MIKSFLGYFSKYIFFHKTKQRLLFLAIIGLVISSFALLVLQSTMGGLQHKLVERSQSVLGTSEIVLRDQSVNFEKEVMTYLKERNIEAVSEFQLELLVRFGNYITPAIIHGLKVDSTEPKFTKELDIDVKTQVIMGRDLAHKIRVDYGAQIDIISPVHVDPLFGDMPRLISMDVDQLIGTNVPEIDNYHLWVPITKLWNLIGEAKYNNIILYAKNLDSKFKSDLEKNFGDKLKFRTWEEKNETLVWALNLENVVMVFLFCAMTIMVSLCITSGLMIFLSKIKRDLSSFWILGASKFGLKKANHLFLIFLSLCSVLTGLGLAFLFLFLFDKFGVEIMPHVFVDRKIPIYITMKGVGISFIIPFTISLCFSLFSYKQYESDADYLSVIRTAS